MDELIIRSLQGKTNQSDERRLADWRGASPAGARHYSHIRRLWELGRALEDGTADEPIPTIQELERQAERPQAPTSIPRPKAQHNRFSWVRNVWKVAALFFLGFAARHFIPDGENSVALGAAEFVTGISEAVTVTLGDGTLVRLAPESRLRLTDGATDREVWLDGRAYFAVTKREGRPFRVRTHAGDAVVLGTRFDLQAQEGQLRLLVVDGKVELAARGTKVAIEASEMSEVVGSAPPTLEKVNPEYVQSSLRWMGDFIAFESTPLRQAAHELSLQYGVPIEVLDSTLAEETVYGWFANEELEDVLNVVCRAVRAHCSIRQAGVTIEP
jgi:ferric-dicitrate binding protein FerR (iron transport regulator)